MVFTENNHGRSALCVLRRTHEVFYEYLVVSSGGGGGGRKGLKELYFPAHSTLEIISESSRTKLLSKYTTIE